jgi:hypothetical protein
VGWSVTARSALATALHSVYVAALPFVVIAFIAVLLLREIPDDDTSVSEHVTAVTSAGLD